MTILFYLAAMVLFGLGAVFIKSSSPYSRSSAKIEGRMERRNAGQTLFAIGILSLGMGFVTQFYSGEEPAGDSPIAITVPPEHIVPPKYIVPPEYATLPEPTDQPQYIVQPGPADQPEYPVQSEQAPPTEQTVKRLMLLLRQASDLIQQKQPDAALDKINAVLMVAPQSPTAYKLRGDINAEKQLWDSAEKDYETSLHFNARNTTVKFNLAEIEFIQKKYDDARAGFVALEHDSNLADLANYKIFLCDLFGGHEEVAAKELAAFNQAKSSISYYFANVAWSLYHHKTEEAQVWLASASRMYPSSKCEFYTSSLVDSGYLTAPPPAPTAPTPPAPP